MFPIVAPKLEDLSSAAQTMVLAIVNKAQPQANPFLLHTLGIPGDSTSTLVDTLTQSLKSRKPVIVGFNETLPAGCGYRLLQMLMEKRANIIFDHSGINAQHAPLLRYAAAIGYKVSLCSSSTLQELGQDELLPVCKALGAALYELGDDGEESLGQQIAKAI